MSRGLITMTDGHQSTVIRIANKATCDSLIRLHTEGGGRDIAKGVCMCACVRPKVKKGRNPVRNILSSAYQLLYHPVERSRLQYNSNSIHRDTITVNKNYAGK